MAEHYQVYFNFFSSGGKYGSLQITFDSERRWKESRNCTQVYYAVLSNIYELGNRYQVNLKVKKTSENFNEVWFVFGDAGTGSEEDFRVEVSQTILKVFEKRLVELSDNPVAVDVRASIARDLAWVFEIQREREEEKKKEVEIKNAIAPTVEIYVAKCPYCFYDQFIGALPISSRRDIYWDMPIFKPDVVLAEWEDRWWTDGRIKVKRKEKAKSLKIKIFEGVRSNAKLEFLDLSMGGPYFDDLHEHFAKGEICRGSHSSVELVPYVKPISEKQLEVKSGLWGIEETCSQDVLGRRCKKCSSKTSGELFILTELTGEQAIYFKGWRMCLRDRRK